MKHRRSRPYATIMDEISKIRRDLAAHQQQIDRLFSGDHEMLSLLKAEKVVLYDEMDRLRRRLETRR